MAQKIRISKTGDAIKGKVQDKIRDIAIDLSNEMKKEAPVFRGTLRDSIQVQETRGYFAVGPQVKYASNIQYGTPPDTEPSLVSLEKWVRRKMGIKDYSWAIAQNLKKKIMDEGPEKNPFISRAIENVRRKY